MQVDAMYCAESRRIFATLIRLLGDFDLVEDVLIEDVPGTLINNYTYLICLSGAGFT